MTKCFSIYIDGERIAPQSVQSFKLTVNVKNLLPIGELVIQDNGGSFLAGLGVKIGSIVTSFLEDVPQNSDGLGDVKLDAPKTTAKPDALTPLVVCRINGSNKNCNESMAGNLTLSLAHPWAIFKSFVNHAYPPQTLGSLIQTVVDDKSRGYPISVGTIDTTDDTAGTPRYKCGISDDEFLTLLLLPFLTSDANPMYSFIDDIGKYNLRSFENLYKVEPTVALVPNMATWSAVSEAYMETNQTIKSFASYTDLALDIGGSAIREMLSALSPKVYFEDTVSGSIKSGILRKSFKLGKKNYLPINKTLMDLGPVSNGYMYQFRTMEDAVGLMQNSTRFLNDLISVAATSMFLGVSLPVGATANLFVVPTEEKKKKVTHWLSGRYVVTEKTYYTDGEMLEAKMLTILSKPIVETNGSAITDISKLYVGYSA